MKTLTRVARPGTSILVCPWCGDAIHRAESRWVPPPLEPERHRRMLMLLGAGRDLPVQRAILRAVERESARDAVEAELAGWIHLHDRHRLRYRFYRWRYRTLGRVWS